MKFRNFKTFTSKGLYSTHTSKIFSRRIIQFRILCQISIQTIQFFLHKNRNRTRTKHSDNRKNCKHPVDFYHKINSTHNPHNYFCNQNTHISRNIPNTVNIVLNTTHQLAAINSVKKIRRQTLNFLKQINAHFRSNFTATKIT